MNRFLSLSERSLEELLWSAASSREEGLVVLRDRDGSRHGCWMHAGFVVGIHVAGRFDPLLDAMRKDGVLDEQGYRSCVESLHSRPERAGALAVDLAGTPRSDVRDALKTQMRGRMMALMAVAARRGHDAGFEAGAIPEGEIAMRMPLGRLLPTNYRTGAVQAALPAAPSYEDRSSRARARKRLRALARKLHPDLNGHLAPEERRARELELARATSEHHAAKQA